jgi:hypothetical protein
MNTVCIALVNRRAGVVNVLTSLPFAMTKSMRGVAHDRADPFDIDGPDPGDLTARFVRFVAAGEHSVVDEHMHVVTRCRRRGLGVVTTGAA